MARKIGDKIRKLRKARNLSQEALANVLGVSFQAVSKWETNVTAPDVGLIPSITTPPMKSCSLFWSMLEHKSDFPAAVDNRY